MRRTRSTTLAALAVLALSAGVAAQQTVQDRTTFVTFSAPVAIPGRTLPAGTYTFRLADTQADRHIVQILDKEKGKLIATMLAVPAERAEQSGEPVVTFKEAPSNRAPRGALLVLRGRARRQRVRLSEVPGDADRAGLRRVGDVD
jgi:hypothetical protein